MPDNLEIKIEHETTFHDMTDEEYDALDEELTLTTPKVSGNGKSGFFMQHRDEIVILDRVSTAWLRAKADTTHQTPSELIGAMVREKIAASA
ncbi:hypothetical protein AGMMS49928_01450 [Spirochaetia bacterium]|nr:hypothetical protein AGMMS49928_01450 [Spirochaetia bacterium]